MNKSRRNWSPIGFRRGIQSLQRGAVVAGAAALVFIALWAAGVRLPLVASTTSTPAVTNSPTTPVLALASPSALEAPLVKAPGVDAFESEEAMLMILASTAPGRNAREGSASIGVSLESAQTIATGGLLPNGTRLIEVHSEYVLLERGRARIELFVANAKPPRLIGRPDESERNRIEEHLLAVGGPQSHGEEIKPPVIGAAAALLRSQPVFVNGVLRGLQVDAGSGAGAGFAVSGLKAGDVVTAIDGVRVEQPEQIHDLIGALGSGVPVVVTVEREGQLEHVSVDMQQIQRATASPPPDMSGPQPLPQQAT